MAEVTTGIAATSTGADLPMTDVIRLAAKATMHLAVLDHVTLEPLALGRDRRLASQAQRFVVFAQYGGCSAPDCPAPLSHCEIHHAHTDWADGGHTDIGDLAPACGPYNRAVGTHPGQWATEKVATGPDRGRHGTDPPNAPRTNHRTNAFLHRDGHLLHGSGHEHGETDDAWAKGVASVRSLIR